MARRARPEQSRLDPEQLTVGVVAPPWIPIPPTGYGGTEAMLDNMIGGLVDLGVHVVVAAHAESRIDGAEVLAGPCDPSGVTIGVAALEIEHVAFAYDEFARRGVDVIHDHTLVGPLVSGARRSPIPVVTTNHGLFDDHLRPIFRELSRVSSVVAISHSQASTSGDVPIAAVIHHGVRPERFPLGRGDGDYVLFLGRMAASKGADHAIHAARAAGVKLVIAAKCWEEEEVRYFERSRAAAARRRRRVRRRSRRGGEARAHRRGDGVVEPDPVGRALRHDDDRVARLWDAGDRDRARRGAGTGRPRRDGLPVRRP